MRLLLVLRRRCLKKFVLVLQASLSMAVLIEGLLFAFHLQVGYTLVRNATVSNGSCLPVGAERHGAQQMAPVDCCMTLVAALSIQTDLATPTEVASQAASVQKAVHVSDLCESPACCRRTAHVCTSHFCHPSKYLNVSFAALQIPAVALACI